MVAQLIQGTFPNFSQLIPAQLHQQGRAPRSSEFLRETRIASVFARDGSGIVRLVVTPGEGVMPGKVTISARADEVGDNEGEIDAAVEGEGVKIAFNGKYLQDVLQALDGGEIAMETTGPSSQGVFRPGRRRRTTSTSSCRCSSNGDKLRHFSGQNTPDCRAVIGLPER